MTHSTVAPTKAEGARLAILARLPCMCCVVMGRNQPSRTTIHHLVDKGTRVLSGGHMATLPLCGWHHVGRQANGMTRVMMAAKYGPSLALQKKAFVERYGTERELLKRIDGLLEDLSKEGA